jgi:hypothetical protein
MHKIAMLAAEAGKAVLRTKPLAVNGPEALEMPEAEEWRGEEFNVEAMGLKDYDDKHFLIKEEKMPDGKLKVILKDKKTGRISQVIQN